MSFWDDITGAFNPAGNVANRTAQPINNNNYQTSSAMPATSGANAQARYADIAAGNAAGQQTFYNDPDMQALRAKREDLAKGYSGQEYGALRQNARAETAGQRQNYLSALQSKLGRGGVGGARGAAMQGAADQRYAQQGAQQERNLALDSANMQRQGQNDLQDFIMRQKYGALGTGLAYGQLGAQDRASAAATAAANQTQDHGILGNLINGLF